MGAMQSAGRAITESLPTKVKQALPGGGIAASSTAPVWRVEHPQAGFDYEHVTPSLSETVDHTEAAHELALDNSCADVQPQHGGVSEQILAPTTAVGVTAVPRSIRDVSAPTTTGISSSSMGGISDTAGTFGTTLPARDSKAHVVSAESIPVTRPALPKLAPTAGPASAGLSGTFYPQ